MRIHGTFCSPRRVDLRLSQAVANDRRAHYNHVQQMHALGAWTSSDEWGPANASGPFCSTRPRGRGTHVRAITNKGLWVRTASGPKDHAPTTAHNYQE